MTGKRRIQQSFPPITRRGKLILDVGCGHKPRGHVNLDLYPERTEHRNPALNGHADRALNTRQIRNFIRADTQHLPLRDATFETVVSSHVIEHVKDPVEMLRELTRVAKHKVVIRYPHRLAHESKREHIHKHHFNKRWFEHTLRKLGYYFTAACVKWRYYPHTLLPLVRLPHEMEITIYKGPMRERSVNERCM